MARIQFASFAEQACDLNVSVISGNLTADKADTYYFWLSYRNDVGWNLPSASSSSATVVADDGIRITIPSAGYQTGENILQYFISVNTEDDASTSKVLLVIDAQTASQIPISLPLNIDITEDEHLETEKSVTTANLPTGDDLLNGILRANTTNGKNYRYISSSSATADGDEVIAAATGRWHVYLDDFSCYLTSTTDSARGADTPLQLIDDTRSILNLEYALDGSAGKFRRYWVFNDNAAPILAGKRIGLTVNNAGEDVSASYVELLKTVFEGYFDKTTRELVTTLADDITSFSYLNIVEGYTADASQNNFLLERNIAQNQAFQFKVYPEFDISQISSSDIIPAFDSELSISPFIYANQGKQTDLGAFLGNAILSTDTNYRRVLPNTGLSVKVLSGSGIVENYFWSNVPESTALGLVADTSNQILAVNTNGSVYRVASLAGNEDQRALVSTTSGESTISSYSVESEGDNNPSITVTVPYPSAIRANYDDVIAGSNLGVFNAENINIYVRKRNSSGGAVVETRRFTANTPTNTTSDDFTITYNDGTIITNGTEPSTAFGLFSPSTPSVDTITNTTGTYFYDVAVSFEYEGNSVTSISHKVSDGCIDELSQSIAELTNTTRYWRDPENDAASLSAIPANELIQGANYPVLSDQNGDISFYTYDSSSSETIDGFDYLDVDNGTGRFVRVKGVDGNDGATGFGIFYTFSTSTSTNPSSGQVRFNNANYASVTAIYLSETDRNSTGISGLLNQVGDGSVLAFVDSDDPTRYAYYSLSSQTDNGSWRTFSVSHIANSGALSGDVTFAFALKGADGATGATGPQGPTGNDGNDGADGAAGINAFGLDYVFDSTTTSGPASGGLRFNNATIGSATELYLHEEEANAVDVSSVLDLLTTDSTFQIAKSTDNTVFHFFNIDSITDNGFDRTYGVSYLGGNGTLTDTDAVRVSFVIKGDTGATGDAGANGSDGADGTSGFGIDFEFDSGTSATPGTGEVRFNNANAASTTEIYVSETDNNAVDVSSVLGLINLGSPLQVIKANDSTTFALFEIDSITDNGTDRTYGVTALANNGTFSDTDVVRLTFSAKGDTGATGPAGGVDSFNGRTGVVVPVSGDYDFADLGTTPTTKAGYGITDVLGSTADTNTIAYTASVNLDMASLTGTYRTISLTGDLTLTSSNRAAGRQVVLRLLADGSTRTLTFPSGWVFLGTKPSDIAADKTGVLSLIFFGTADTDCVASWGVEA
jgi:hypothetical protein